MREQEGATRRRRKDRVVPGRPSGVEAPLLATATAVERAEGARAVVLVEGISDQIAVEVLAGRLGRDLAAEAIVVVPTGGAHGVTPFLRRFGPMGRDLRLSGLCDAAEAPFLGRALGQAGLAEAPTRGALEAQGFFTCDRDLEDELIRAAGPEAIEAILATEGELGSFRTLQGQAAWRDAGFAPQFRRFLGAGARRKARWAGLLAAALPLDRQPRPLLALLERA